MRARPWLVPMVAGLVVGGVVAGGCSSDGEVETADTSTSAPGTSTGPGEEPVACVDLATYQWFGASRPEAIARAEAEGRPWRIGREDDQVADLTDDLVPGRVTFELDDGTVTFAIVEQDDGVRVEGAQDPADVGFIGLSRAEAEARAEEAGLAWRTVRVGDEVVAATLDVSPDRRSFELDGDPPCDTVTAVTRG